ncbi:polysaccharide pyruvyl transferase family protein [Lactiplantibacillus plajomi]|uniref:Polysaccharide pyruvyl transferase family protein n=1 Tax=Lactiplantibacillus plajomi TaxID=1457217 RepID=A0ABV6K2T8_9LACO|nr:polysaccharide pyruvyl transferase family protein [Lactiplantibacillus plajomi]
MKLAIDTIVDYSNYGNRLQNYALQTVLENLGHEVVTLRNYTHVVPSEPRKKRLLRLLKEGHFLDKGRRKVIKRIKRLRQSKKYNQLRINNFIAFTNDYIHETSATVTQESTDFSFDNSIDGYVVGSDQVWNCNFSRFSGFDFISFSDKPRISYAASFGISEIPDKFVDVYREGLANFNAISVRELAGKQLVESLSNMSAEVVLDPTLLLEPEDWLELTNGRKRYTEKYVLVYFLGKQSREDKRYIEAYAKKHGLQIKTLATYDDLDLWVADPAEFINLFSQADAIFTDSFHACVFSIMFEKYFEAFSRRYDGPSMDSRLETLFADLGLSDRWHTNVITNNNNSVDYSVVKNKLLKRRAESLHFLEQALLKMKRA